MVCGFNRNFTVRREICDRPLSRCRLVNGGEAQTAGIQGNLSMEKIPKGSGEYLNCKSNLFLDRR